MNSAPKIAQVAREKLAQERAAAAQASPLAVKLREALKRQALAEDAETQAKAACEVARIETALMHERLATVFDGRGAPAEKLEVARMVGEAANAAGRIHALERQALGLGADGQTQKSDLDTVLRAMEASGEIAGPVAHVAEEGQHEEGPHNCSGLGATSG